MSSILRTAIAGLALSAISLSALAEEVGAMAEGVGSVKTVTGETGSVIVVRGAETYSLGPNDVLFEGDKIITQSEGATEVTAYGCTQTLAALESITISPDFCTQIVVSVAEDGTVLADAAIVEGTGGVGAALPIAGALLAAGGAAAAAGGGGDDGASSP